MLLPMLWKEFFKKFKIITNWWEPNRHFWFVELKGVLRTVVPLWEPPKGKIFMTINSDYKNKLNTEKKQTDVTINYYKDLLLIPIFLS